MKELRLIELMGDIDEALLLRANAPVPLWSKPKFRAATASALIAALLVITMIASPIAMVVSYGNAHPEIKGGLVYVMDAMISDENHFLHSLLPDGVKNTLGSVFDALKGKDHKDETESESTSESETEPQVVIPPASKGLELEFNANHDGYRVMGIGSCMDVNVVIPSEYNGLPVTEIYWSSGSGDYAFQENTDIQSVYIPASVQTISEFAFYKCTSLKSVTIASGDAPLRIGMCAFSGCPLEEFVVPENTERFHDPLGFTNTDTTYEKTFPKVTEYDNAYYAGNENNPYFVLIRVKDTAARSCAIHPDTKIIGGGAFYQSALTEITIPEGVTAIDDKAFCKTASLQSLSVPNSLRFVGADVFDGSAVVVSKSSMDYAGTKETPYLILLGGTLTDAIDPGTRFVADKAFFEERCQPKMMSLTIPESVHYIGDYAFNGMKNSLAIQSLTVMGDDLYVGSMAFASSDRLSEITIGSGVSHITPMAFNQHSMLQKITVQEGNVKYYVQDNCLIERESRTLMLGCRDSVFPTDADILHIADGAFFGTRISFGEIPEGVLSIGGFAFFMTMGEDKLVIPHSVICIEDTAFASNNGMKIYYNGTKKEWLTIQSKAVVSSVPIYCTNGELNLNN